MKFRSVTLLTASLAVLVLAGAEARAGFVNWTYNWSRLPADVVSADAFGTSRLSLTDEPVGNATNSSDIVATNIRTFSNAPRATPNKFLEAAYALTLNLKDLASGETATMTFSGLFSGTLSSSSAGITTRFTGETIKTATLGGSVYEVTLGEFSPPGPPGISNAGSISAHVELTPKPDDPPPPPPNDTPEPSTVLLSGLGLGFLGLASWRKWKQRRLLALA